MHQELHGGRVAKIAELIDLYCEGQPKERSLDQAANVAMPARW
jgi:hypothetical protein